MVRKVTKIMPIFRRFYSFAAVFFSDFLKIMATVLDLIFASCFQLRFKIFLKIKKLFEGI